MYIPEIEELQEIADSIDTRTCTPAQVLSIIAMRDSLRELIETFNVDSFDEGSTEAMAQVIKTQKRTDEMIKVFGPYMAAYLLCSDLS